MKDEKRGGEAPGIAGSIEPHAGALAHADTEVNVPAQASVPARASVLVTAERLGRYMVLELLGTGGMGEVYAAFDPELDRRIAIKLLRPGRRASASAQQRLAREARALARLSHPNVVHVYDVGVHGEAVFVAMELVQGQSLRAWCRQEPPPGWRAVLDAYLAAARGLAAAHAVGLIHRDFKPANVLRGEDGRVRVADFGLAVMRAMVEDSDPTEPDSAPPGSATGVEDPRAARLTSTGALMGTPAYMAPEQYDSAAVGPAADQYAFCVSLYEGLYGRLPFGLDPLMRPAEHLRRKRSEPVERPPGTDVPEWVHRILARGLAPSPADRWPSMEALIAALEKDPAARRRALGRALAIGALGAALAGVVAVLALSRSQADPAAACAASGQLAGVWDAAVKARMQKAFMDTGLAYAADTFDRVAAILDQRADAWTAMRTQVCEATYVHHTQPLDVLNLRVRCLEQRRSHTRALTELLARGPDPAVVPRAVLALESLPSLEECSDVDSLARATPLPADPDTRARVEALEGQVDDLEALSRAALFSEGLERGTTLLAEMAEVDHAPLLSRALHLVASMRKETGDHAGAEALARQALEVAARGQDDLRMARTWSLLVRVVGHEQARYEEAQGMMLAATAAAERANDAPTLADALDAVATVYYHMGQYGEALERYERALALKEQARGPQDPALAGALSNLANVLTGLGRYDEALERYERAVAILEQALGPAHPHLGAALGNLGILLYSQGRQAEALQRHERAIAILEQALGPTHPNVGNMVASLGNVLIALGRYEEALARHERAVAILEQALGPEHPQVGFVLSCLGESLAELGRYDEALPQHERALAIVGQAMGPDSPGLVNGLNALGRLYLRMKKLDQAARHFERARVIAEKSTTLQGYNLAGALSGMGELALARDQPAQAVAPLERALTIDDPLYRAAIQLTLARALWESGGDRQRAVTLARAAGEHYERIGNQPRRDEVLRWLAAHAAPGQ